MHSPIRDVLRHKGSMVHTVPPDEPVRAAVRRMNVAGIGALLVMDGDRIVGMFTERDVLRRVVDAELDPSRTKVHEVMTRPVIIVRSDTTVEEAMGIMTERRCRHLPVLEEDHRAVGLVSIGDLMRWVLREQEIAIHDLVEYVQGSYPG